MAKQFYTRTGSIEMDALGLILPHEHLFTDLRGPSVPDYAQGDISAVVEVVRPFLAEAYAAGVTALVEGSTVGVGRNLSVLRALAEATRFTSSRRPAYTVMGIYLRLYVI